MKKQLKIMSLLLSLVLLLASGTPFTAKANGSINMDDNATLITPSSNAIYSIRAADAPAELCQALNAMNIATQSNTLIEVVPLSGEDGGTAVVVTNASGVAVTKDILVAPDAEEGFVDLTVVPTADTYAYGSGGAYFPSYSNNLIHAVVNFEHYTGGYYRPHSLQVLYTSNGIDVVTNMDVRYYCEGFVYTFPEMEALTEGGMNTYCHEILLFKAVPESGEVYASHRSYSSDRVIYVGGDGAPATSHDIAFSVYINGVRRTGRYTVDTRWGGSL